MRRWTRSARRRLRGVGEEGGAAAVEFALVSLLLFTLLFGVIDFGFGFYTWGSLGNAAREGARKGAVDADVDDIEDRFRNSATGLDDDDLRITITCSSGGTGPFVPCGTPTEGDIVRVSGEYDYGFITPLGGMVGLGDTMTMRVNSEARFEG